MNKRIISCLLGGSVLLGSFPAYGADRPIVREIDLGERASYSSITVGYRQDTEALLPMSQADGRYLYVLAPEGVPLEAREVTPAVFADVEASAWHNGLNELSARGVLTGDGNGQFQGERLLSHGEMAVILARLFSVPTGYAGDSWYQPSIAALEQVGVLPPEGVPERPVTREELVIASYRMVAARSDLKALPEQAMEQTLQLIGDYDELTRQGKIAYAAMLGNHYQVVAEYAENDMADLSDDRYFLRPNQYITRYDAANFFNDLLNCFLSRNAPAVPKGEVLAREMPRIDGSTSTYQLTRAIYATLFRNGSNHPALPASHSKTIASYCRLIQGEADIILVPDPNSDVQALAQQQGVTLTYLPIANEALVFFTGKDNPTPGLTKQQVVDIYADNAYENWNRLGGPDAPLAAFCRNGDSGSHAQMEHFFLNGKGINPDIQRERTSILMASILTDVQDYEQQNPGAFALGYSMYYYFQTAGTVLGTDGLKLLEVDGIPPTENTLADGSYPLTTSYFAVLRADEPEDSPARQLANWLIGPEGRQCLEAAGFQPIALQ